MKVDLFKNPDMYSCNMYFVRGNWNKLSDLNTIIDVGTNDFIMHQVKKLSTGVGKSPIEQIVLTHEHFDHTSGLKFILKEYSPKVYALSSIKGVTHQLKEGMILKLGDEKALVIHTPGHSNDSICLYTYESKVLFSGDTPLNIKAAGGTYTSEYIYSLEKLLKLDIKTIFSGHDAPIRENALQTIQKSYNIVTSSKIID